MCPAQRKNALSPSCIGPSQSQRKFPNISGAIQEIQFGINKYTSGSFSFGANWRNDIVGGSDPNGEFIGELDMNASLSNPAYGAAQLVNKCYLRFYKVKGLRSILTNDVARRGFEVQMENVRQFQSIEGMTLGDVDDDFQTTNYTFTGLPEILLQFAQQISGATGIPLVRLFGQSPVGFNSTGESDIRLYYDNTKQAQEKMLRPGMKKILNAIYMSITGQAPDRDFNFDFRPLWQMTNEQKAQSATAMVGAIVQALQNEAIPLPTAMKELKKLSPVLGMFSSITDEDIAEAEKQENELMPPMAGEEINGAEQIQRSDQNANSGEMVSKETERGSQTNWANR